MKSPTRKQGSTNLVGSILMVAFAIYSMPLLATPAVVVGVALAIYANK
jgi:hypothetical protein